MVQVFTRDLPVYGGIGQSESSTPEELVFMVFKIEKTSASQRRVGPSQSGCRRVSIECIVPHYIFIAVIYYC